MWPRRYPREIGSLIARVDAPLAQLLQHRDERVLAFLVLRVQRGEVLREALAEPLLVVVAPADRLSPPLMGELVREEEIGIVAERRRIVSPDERRARQRLVEHREIARAVSARQIAFDDGDGEARIRRVADRSIRRTARCRPRGRPTSRPRCTCTRVGFDRQVQASVRLAGDAGLFLAAEANRCGLGAREPAQEEREIPQRLRGGEQVDLPVLRRILRRKDRRKSASSSPLATQSTAGGTEMRMRAVA